MAECLEIYEDMLLLGTKQSILHLKVQSTLLCLTIHLRLRLLPFEVRTF